MGSVTENFFLSTTKPSFLLVVDDDGLPVVAVVEVVAEVVANFFRTSLAVNVTEESVPCCSGKNHHHPS